MVFYAYWKSLIDRVHHKKEILVGPEELVYRLTCIYGETMVDGVEAYFERRYREFERDQETLKENGFSDIAADFEAARQALFENETLTESFISSILDRLLQEHETDKQTLKQIDSIYERLIVRLPRVLDRRDEIGVENRLFQPEVE